LTLSTRFVRDGYIRFRYAVDAEDGYDGLLFEMDGNLVWNKTAAGRGNTWQIHLE